MLIYPLRVHPDERSQLRGSRFCTVNSGVRGTPQLVPWLYRDCQFRPGQHRNWQQKPMPPVAENPGVLNGAVGALHHSAPPNFGRLGTLGANGQVHGSWPNP